MRLIVFILIAVLLSGCPQPGTKTTSTSTAVPATSSQPAKTVVLLCSNNESDPWTESIISATGDKLSIDPWSLPGEDDHIDTYGPYDAKLGEYTIKLIIGMSGIDRVADIESLRQLGENARKWIVTFDPDVVWLEGDPAQFYVGAELDEMLPIVFSGVESDASLFYEPGRQASGVYRRHSISRVIGEIWKLAPDAKVFALLSDDSPIDMQRLLLFRQYESALPQGHGMLVLEPVTKWSDFPTQLAKANEHADALIICGVGAEGSSGELRDQPPPPDLLAQIDIPVVALGPSRVDHTGLLSLHLQPADHADAALQMIEQVLAGNSPLAVGPVMPEGMTAFRSELDAPAGATPPADAS